MTREEREFLKRDVAEARLYLSRYWMYSEQIRSPRSSRAAIEYIEKLKGATIMGGGRLDRRYLWVLDVATCLYAANPNRTTVQRALDENVILAAVAHGLKWADIEKGSRIPWKECRAIAERVVPKFMDEIRRKRILLDYRDSGVFDPDVAAVAEPDRCVAQEYGEPCAMPERYLSQPAA